MSEYILTPKVDSTQEFIEIAFDFSNPLDLVREAISNSFDAKATEMTIAFDVETVRNKRVLKIQLRDNGQGMDENDLQSFFDLGNSQRRDRKQEDTTLIGEKGHGTKVYLNSDKIEVVTVKNNVKLTAVMESPMDNLYARVVPTVTVSKEETADASGTSITIWGYNNNDRSMFNHERLKDYIIWFTKMGSFEKEFGHEENINKILRLKGVGSRTFEDIPFGHVFPSESESVIALFESYIVDAPKWYCKKYKRSGNLVKYPEISFELIMCVEGTRIKYSSNPMIRRSGYTAPAGSYTVQERYGLWLCKDYIPIQRKNEWISPRGSEYTKFHAFVNCQDLRLTANRGSIENTPSEYIEELKKVVVEEYERITQGNDWKDLEWLENEVQAFNTVKKERSDFEYRIKRINAAKVADYKGIRLVEPTQENGVFSMFMQLSSLEKDLFPFEVIDYDTHVGIDVIVKAKDRMPIKASKLYYVEFKNFLQKHFNHSFVNLYSIVCWDIDTKIIKNNDEVTDISGARRTSRIIPPANQRDRTRYFLDDTRGRHKIEIFVLKRYLEEVSNISFRARNDNDVY